MHESPKLRCTRDYDIFDMHAFNRPLHEDPRLLESMRQHGFMPSSPAQCVRNGGGKLKVIRGHHRIDYAKRLKLPVFYVIDESNTDIHALENVRQQWSIGDFVHSYAIAGNAHYQKILDFQKAHHLTLGAAISLVGGETAGSANQVKQVKPGTFKIAADLTHAIAVVAVTDRLSELGMAFATSSAFVSAISKALRIPEFSSERFLHRARLYPALMQKRSTVNDCLAEIEGLYNYGAKEKRVPVAFRAKEIGRIRQETFGGHRQPRKRR